MEKNLPSHLRFGDKRSIQSQLLRNVLIASLFTHREVSLIIKMVVSSSSSFFFSFSFCLELLSVRSVVFQVGSGPPGTAHFPGLGGVGPEGAGLQMRVQRRENKARSDRDGAARGAVASVWSRSVHCPRAGGVSEWVKLEKRSGVTHARAHTRIERSSEVYAEGPI